MIDWEAARADLQETVAGIFDVTPCSLQPMTKGQSVNHAPTTDPDRAGFDFMGTIDLQPPADRLMRHPPGDTGTRGATVAYAAVLSAHVADWPYLPRRGDIFVTPSGQYRIEASERDGSQRPAWYLSEVKHAVS